MKKFWVAKILALTWHMLGKKKVIVRKRKGHKIYMENPSKKMKNHDLSKNGKFLLCSETHFLFLQSTRLETLKQPLLSIA